MNNGDSHYAIIPHKRANKAISRDLPTNERKVNHVAGYPSTYGLTNSSSLLPFIGSLDGQGNGGGPRRESGSKGCGATLSH